MWSNTSIFDNPRWIMATDSRHLKSAARLNATCIKLVFDKDVSSVALLNSATKFLSHPVSSWPVFSELVLDRSDASYVFYHLKFESDGNIDLYNMVVCELANLAIRSAENGVSVKVFPDATTSEKG